MEDGASRLGERVIWGAVVEVGEEEADLSGVVDVEQAADAFGQRFHPGKQSLRPL